jgi:hypothetical protein
MSMCSYLGSRFELIRSFLSGSLGSARTALSSATIVPFLLVVRLLISGRLGGSWGHVGVRLRCGSSRCTTGRCLGQQCLVVSAAVLCFGHLGRLVLSCLVAEASSVWQWSILACQSVSLVDLDGDDALWSRHLYCGIGSMDDCLNFRRKGLPRMQL